MVALCARTVLVASSKVLGVSMVYSGLHVGGFRLDGMTGCMRSPVIRCEQILNPIGPINLRLKRSEERHILYRVLRGLVRAGWLCFKLLPGIVTFPLSLFSERASKLWWRYTIWALATSGPTAIKFSQWVGTRPDLFPRSAVDALSALHTASVSHYSLANTTADLDGIYGPSWRDWLELLDDAKLIGSGAIAHVSRGRLISGPHKGTEVALKLVHRGVAEVVEADLDIMEFVAWTLSHFPQLTPLDVPGAAEEFGKFMRSQINMLTEAENINRFTVLFRDRPDIKFPKVFIQHCTKDILVESFEAGIPLGQIIEKGSSALRRKVCDLGVAAFLKMLFVDNFVHGDMHPGNVIFQPANGETSLAKVDKPGKINGKVVLIDCGLIAQLGPKDEKNFLDLMHAVITGRSREVGRLMIERSRSPPETVYNPDEFCDKVAKLVDTTVTGKSLIFGGLEFGALITQLLNIARQHKVRLETDFVSVAFALVILEGVGKQLDPKRNLLWEAEPYILRQFLRRAKDMVTKKEAH